MGTTGEFGQCAVDMVHGARAVQAELQQSLNSHFPQVRLGDGNRGVRFRRIDFLRDGLFEISRTERSQVQILLQIDIFSGEQGSSHFKRQFHFLGSNGVEGLRSEGFLAGVDSVKCGSIKSMARL